MNRVKLLDQVTGQCRNMSIESGCRKWQSQLTPFLSRKMSATESEKMGGDSQIEPKANQPPLRYGVEDRLKTHKKAFSYTEGRVFCHGRGGDPKNERAAGQSHYLRFDVLIAEMNTCGPGCVLSETVFAVSEKLLEKKHRIQSF